MKDKRDEDITNTTMSMSILMLIVLELNKKPKLPMFQNMTVSRNAAIEIMKITQLSVRKMTKQ